MSGVPWMTSAGNGKVGWVYRPDLAEAYLPMLVMTQKGIREGGLEAPHTDIKSSSYIIKTSPYNPFSKY